MNQLYRRFGKRAIDITVAASVLAVLAPLLLLVAALVRLKLGKPVLFCQQRPGRGGRVFRILKFRTMTDERDPSGDLLPDDRRLTRFGRFLRSSSLDELPELWNVLVGEMSLVGPRPLRVQYLSLYSPEQPRRHEVPPGITGWAQVNGRNSIGWDERFRLDVWYVANCGFWLDLKILLLTVTKVARRDGISAGGHATMPDFTGAPELADTLRIDSADPTSRAAKLRKAS